ncbi:MAG TPA: rRNA adenine N-6-methyltransferase family protein, partial [Burkholderiaceae bacterium]|nr:rRNA adenine N-6-methyltransferase family protein [Burkholderiaceae bacterium]
MMAHRPRKRFGQHFLIDEGVVEAIVRAVAPEADQHLVEIGPGLSALTAPLLQAVPHLTAIEIDRDLARRLRRQYSEQQLQLVETDVLQVDFAELAQLVLGASKAQASNDDAAAAVETRGGRRVLRAAGATGARHQGQLRLVGNLPYNISTPLLFHLSEFV